MTAATPGAQLLVLFILAIPVAAVAWTVTHEEIFDEAHRYCVRKSKRSRSIVARKFFYMLTCEYCFSHYVAIGAVAGTGYHLLLDDWRGLIIAVFALVWVANHYMGLFARLKLDVKLDRIEVEREEGEGGEGTAKDKSGADGQVPRVGDALRIDPPRPGRATRR